MHAVMRDSRSRSWSFAALVVAAGAGSLLAVTRAEAFCGFYVSGSAEGLFNKATRVALMRQGTRTVLSMSNDYDGPPEDFAMVVPVPVVLSQSNVRTLPHDVFDHVEALTAPRLVEYWEQNPCPEEGRQVPGVAMDLAQPTSLRLAAAESYEEAERTVRVEARFAVGEYEVVILSATESSGLETWLRGNRYNIPRGAAAYLAPYVRGEWKFFVARVDVERAQRRPGGGVRLSPLRMHYDATEFRLPVRLGLLNAPTGPQDLIVYVLHPEARFEVANYRNVFIPTNLDVKDEVRERFPAFYAALFDATVQSSGQRAVVTEYAWSTGGCDPCPSPALDANDLATLGADVVDDFQGSSMVVTRLHARYNAATLTDDLVFREATPVVGGREMRAGAEAALERGAQRTSQGNSFQARYAIRHPWTGPVTCEHPQRGVWGANPQGGGSAPALAARDLADAPREALSLPSVVLSEVPGVDLNARLALPAATEVTHPPQIPNGARRGCACAVGASPVGARELAALGVLAGALARWRRARRSVKRS